MMNEKYPPLDLDQLMSAIFVIEASVDDVNYLDPATCPYDAEIRKRLNKLSLWITSNQAAAPKPAIEPAPVGRPRSGPVLPVEEIEKEMDEIRKEIGQLKLDSKDLETADRIQIIKTRAALVEKIIAMKERTNNLKKQAAFVSNVIGIMEDILEQPQRDEMIKRLEPYLDAE